MSSYFFAPMKMFYENILMTDRVPESQLRRIHGEIGLRQVEQVLQTS